MIKEYKLLFLSFLLLNPVSVIHSIPMSMNEEAEKIATGLGYLGAVGGAVSILAAYKGGPKALLASIGTVLASCGIYTTWKSYKAVKSYYEKILAESKKFEAIQKEITSCSNCSGEECCKIHNAQLSKIIPLSQLIITGFKGPEEFQYYWCSECQPQHAELFWGNSNISKAAIENFDTDYINFNGEARGCICCAQEGSSVLALAIAADYQDIVKLLLNKGAIEGPWFFHDAVMHASKETLDLLYKEECLDKQIDISDAPAWQNGSTPLHFACKQNAEARLEGFDYLLSKNVNPCIKNNEGKTPRDILIEQIDGFSAGIKEALEVGYQEVSLPYMHKRLEEANIKLEKLDAYIENYSKDHSVTEQHLGLLYS